MSAKLKASNKPTIWRSPPLYWNSLIKDWATKEYCSCAPGCPERALSACGWRIDEEFLGVSKRKPIVIAISTKRIRGAVKSDWINFVAAEDLGVCSLSTKCWWWIEQ